MTPARGHRAGAAVGVVLALAALSGCTDDAPPPPAGETQQPEPAATSGPAAAVTLDPACPPPPDERGDAASADDVNRLLSDADLPRWDAADIGASVPLSDGRIAWVFGDTVSTGDSPGIVANSMLVSSGPCVSQVLPAELAPLIPDVGRRTVHWPMSVVAVEEEGHDRLAVFCSRIRRGTSGDPLDFTYLGSSVALFEVPAGGVPALVEWQELTPDDEDPHQVNWGAASFRDARSLYVYGTRTTDQDLVFGRELYVGRAPLSSTSDRSTYRFWDGAAWQPDVRRAAPILPARGGVSQTLSVHQLGPGSYLATSKRDGDLGEFVYTWGAPTPHGPWTPERAVPAPNDLDEGILRYAPLAHPEVPLRNGKLLVSVSRNTTDFRRLVEEPELGVPEFVDVTYPQ